MEVCIYNEQKYAKIQNHIFIYDGAWGSLRPFEKVGWNGKQFVLEDFEFKKDLFSPLYGYGSEEMKLLCKKLTEQIDKFPENKILDPVDFWKWCGTSTVWFKDRHTVFAKTCNNLDWRKYIEYLGSKHRTLRRPAKNRMTRRLVRK
jgi:hypothetical protein